MIMYLQEIAHCVVCSSSIKVILEIAGARVPTSKNGDSCLPNENEEVTRLQNIFFKLNDCLKKHCKTHMLFFVV